MDFRNTVAIDRPLDEVFSYVTDFENVPKWNYAVQETRMISNGDQPKGRKYLQKREFLGREIEDTYEVVEFHPNKKVSIKSTSGPFPFEFRYTFVGGSEKTEITNDIHLETNGIFKFVDKRLQPRVKEAVAGNLKKLKQVLEEK
jgi:uncharacterized membrane protein